MQFCRQSVGRAGTQSRSQSFVPLDQRSENESSGSNHFEITKANNRILVIRLTAQSQSAYKACYGACLKWILPELSFSDRWSRGTKLWKRDWPNLVPRASFPLTSGRKTRALGQTISGMRHSMPLMQSETAQ